MILGTKFLATQTFYDSCFLMNSAIIHYLHIMTNLTVTFIVSRSIYHFLNTFSILKNFDTKHICIAKHLLRWHQVPNSLTIFFKFSKIYFIFYVTTNLLRKLCECEKYHVHFQGFPKRLCTNY